MASASYALQKALHARLIADAAVLAALGGPRIFDDVPRGQAMPYVTFAMTSARDWSTGSDEGEEHTLTLHAWSRAAGRHEAQAVVAALRGALHEAALTLEGHRLVNLRQEAAEVRRDADNETWHGIVRLRAVTEKGE